MLLSSPADNEALMGRLAQDRCSLAGILGVGSYAEYTLDASTLAGSPEAVASFLHNLNASLQPQVRSADLYGLSSASLLQNTTNPRPDMTALLTSTAQRASWPFRFHRKHVAGAKLCSGHQLHGRFPEHTSMLPGCVWGGGVPDNVEQQPKHRHSLTWRDVVTQTASGTLCENCHAALSSTSTRMTVSQTPGRLVTDPPPPKKPVVGGYNS